VCQRILYIWKFVAPVHDAGQLMTLKREGASREGCFHVSLEQSLSSERESERENEREKERENEREK